MLHTKFQASKPMQHKEFQASKPSSSEEEDFVIFFYIFLGFELRTQWRGTILDPGIFV